MAGAVVEQGRFGAVGALTAGWLGALVGLAGLIVAAATVVMRLGGRNIELDYTASGIVGGLGAVYLTGGVLLVRRRIAGRRVLVVMAGLMSAATLLVIALNAAGHGVRFGPLDWWLMLNVVILTLSVIEPTRRWTTTR